MSQSIRIGLLGLAILTGLALTWGVVQAAMGTQIQMVPDYSTPMPEQPVFPVPDITTIQSVSPSCTVSRAKTGICLVTWSYLYVGASPNYMITMTVELDGRARARYNGFFQEEIYVPSELIMLKVPCGAPGSSGDPAFGKIYGYTIRARDSLGLKSANYGSIACPADVRPPVYLPLLRR